MLLSHVCVEGFTLTLARVTPTGTPKRRLCAAHNRPDRWNQPGRGVVGMHITTRQAGCGTRKHAAALRVRIPAPAARRGEQRQVNAYCYL
ncbi:hypothetical protein GCM10009834_14570 [Streptomonospora arabica]|uniref:Uncharacterized protein n=1 Tax=Streptomonospora halophila TaxID=427369 RepID=A0ABP9GQK2_9ACTN